MPNSIFLVRNSLTLEIHSAYDSFEEAMKAATKRSDLTNHSWFVSEPIMFYKSETAASNE